MKINKIIVCMFLSVLFSSCVNSGEINNTKGDVIVEITPYDNTNCKFKTHGHGNMGSIFIHPITFVDSCGKYKVGDTIYIIK